MTRTLLTTQADREQKDFMLFSPGVLKVEISARIALTKALESLVRQLDLADIQVVVDRLRQGDQSLWNDLHFKLSEQVAEQLGVLDQNVKAVYIDEYGEIVDLGAPVWELPEGTSSPAASYGSVPVKRVGSRVFTDDYDSGIHEMGFWDHDDETFLARVQDQLVEAGLELDRGDDEDEEYEDDE